MSQPKIHHQLSHFYKLFHRLNFAFLSILPEMFSPSITTMWSVWLPLISLVIIGLTHLVYKWRNPKCNGKLPPGSMGLPLIGETIQFFIPNKSLDFSPFIKERMKRYGLLFKTSLVGRSVVISSDPDFNHFLFGQEGKLVELWYMDSFAKLLQQNSDSTTATGYIHKYLRNLILSHFGTEILKQKLHSDLEVAIRKALDAWCELPEVEFKNRSAAMIFEITAKQIFSYCPKKSEENISEKLVGFLQALMSFPVNIPGTTFHRCLKNKRAVEKIIGHELEERAAFPERRQGDLLDQVLEDMKTEKFLNKDFVVHMMFGLLLASFETISATLTLAMKLLTEHPSVVQELTEEHEELLKNRENPESGLTWNEYKSMTFTHHVGYTIPKGWTIMVVPAVIQLNPRTYEDPLAFNPHRWKDMGAIATAKNFIPFGGGSRSCAGADFSKVFMAVFIHVLVTNYSWTKIKGGNICRTPALRFRDGFHIKVSKKKN
ncbi:Cytochrome P450 [Dillenia turbinata]|uniref:Cytochrome P450 n=1 Tax=Dillenia turbinata TaxID=194707 RepID=A0AAN8VS86_9MAGN